ncbi:MAG: hypothetical protein ACRDLB_08985 [Actinomycetota bacterium]
MSYRTLDAERLMAIVKAMTRVAAAPLDPEEVAEAAALEAKTLTGAARASLQRVYRGGTRRVLHDELQDAGTSISVPVECAGAQIGLLTVAKDAEDGFGETDIESLRLLGECVSSLLSHAMTHADVGRAPTRDRHSALA